MESRLTLDDVKQYFEGERLTCLLCGRTFKGLGKHLGPVHGISARAYKKQFGLPFTRGLVCKSFRATISAIAIEQNRVTRLPPGGPPGEKDHSDVSDFEKSSLRSRRLADGRGGRLTEFRLAKKDKSKSLFFASAIVTGWLA